MSTSPNPNSKLVRMAAWRLVAGVVIVGVLLFLPAGDLGYWQAWVYIGLLFIPVTVVGSLLLLRDPKLIERRMRFQERREGQRSIVLISSAVMLLLLILPGLDHRFGWSQVPAWFIGLADLMIFLGYLLTALTLRENSFASRVIEVDAGQRVITTGPYGWVRHPMYLGMSIMFGFTPLGLGSWWGLLASMVFPLTLIGRIQDEEAMLHKELPGYDTYSQRVRFRLLPLIW